MTIDVRGDMFGKPYGHAIGCVCQECHAADRFQRMLMRSNDLSDEVMRLNNELETERMRLAACGVAAMQNTREAAKERIHKDNPYWSASYDDVCRAVDAEIKYREELETLQKNESQINPVFAYVAAERERQDEKWGGATNDDQWNCLDWHEMIADYNAWARRMAAMGSPEKARKRYIQIAALAVAAVEALDRKSRKVSMIDCTFREEMK